MLAIRSTIVACCTAVLAAGCGGQPADKAGNAARAGTKVLTLANGDTGTRDVGAFVAAVSRVSGGRLEIRLRSKPYGDDPDYERKLIADTRAGRFDLVKVGARAWDLVGVKTFAPLVAPLAITSMSQQERVVRSPLAHEILAGVRPLGLQGIALLPSDFRYPVGLTRVVTGARDFHGAIAAIRPSHTAEAAFAALGATAKPVVAGGDYDGFDIAEQDTGTLANASGTYQARSMTGDLPLWPRTQSIVMTRSAYEKLSDEQRKWLAEAATAAIAGAAHEAREFTREGVLSLCDRDDFALVRAGTAQRAAIERATARLLADIRHDAAARRILDGILQMRGTLDALSCPAPPDEKAPKPSGKPSPIDGVWKSDVTRSRYFAAHPLAGEDNEGNWGPHTMVLDRGRFTITNARFAEEVVGSGTFTVDGNLLVLWPLESRHVPGEHWKYRWSAYRGVMRLRRDTQHDLPTALRAAPWIKSH
jgi:TRAP-type C4-dicarboxylate transport system substrate-binding protein